MSESGSFSRSSDAELRRRLDQTKTISSEASDQVSLLESIGEHAAELRKCREENIALKAQLKMAQDSAKLMEAEFAFQRSQLETEIEKLKSDEAKLRESLLKCQSEKSETQYDVNLCLKYEQKYEALKDTARELSQENEDLRKKLDDQAKASKLVEAQSQLADENEALKLKIKSMQDSYEVREKEIAAIFEKQTAHWRNRIERRNAAIEQLQAKLEEAGTASVTTDTDHEVNKLKQKLQRQTKKLQKMKEISDRNKELTEINAHYDAERQVLNDIMETEDIDPNLQWFNLREKAKAGMEALAKIQENMDILIASEKRISELVQSEREFDTIRRKLQESEKRNEQIAVWQQKAAHADGKLCEIKAITERITAFANQQKIRCDFARLLADNQKKLVTDITHLYEELTGRKDQLLRPIVLAAIFLNRWRKISTVKNTEFDPTSLVAFTSVSKNTIEAKMRSMERLFVALSQEVVDTKNKVVEEKQRVKKIKQQFLDAGGDIEATKLELDNAKMQLNQCRDRLKKLSDESARMVPPEKFQQMMSRVTDVELENENLQQSLKAKQREIEEKNEHVLSMVKEVRKSEARHDAAIAEIARLEAEIEKQNTDNAVLKSKLNDRTRDVLALERISNINVSYGEESEQRNADIEINPVFLGSRK